MSIPAKAAPRIVVVGSVNTDIILSVAALPRANETILGRGSRTVVGGKGLKYVKSSGLVADGGNFDAAKPGAGREADREFFFFYFFSCGERCG